MAVTLSRDGPAQLYLLDVEGEGLRRLTTSNAIDTEGAWSADGTGDTDPIALAQAITLWKLHTTTPEDKVKADYDAAIKTLRDIAQGVIRIPDAAGVDATPSGAQGVQFIDRERPFTPENMTGFI